MPRGVVDQQCKLYLFQSTTLAAFLLREALDTELVQLHSG